MSWNVRTLSTFQARRVYDRAGAGRGLDKLAVYEDRATRQVVSHFALAKAQNVFEFGCGTGRSAHLLLEEYLRDNARYCAIDLSPAGVLPLSVKSVVEFSAGKFSQTMKNSPMFTGAANASGQPAISLPLQWTADGLPIGIQLMARPADETTLLRVSAQLEEAKPWAHRRPPVS